MRNLRIDNRKKKKSRNLGNEIFHFVYFSFLEPIRTKINKKDFIKIKTKTKNQDQKLIKNHKPSFFSGKPWFSSDTIETLKLRF